MRSVAAVVVAGLALGSTGVSGGAPAAAASVVEPTVEAPARVVSIPLGSLSSSDHFEMFDARERDDLGMGPSTETVTVRAARPALADVLCVVEMRIGYSEEWTRLTEVAVPAAEWDATGGTTLDLRTIDDASPEYSVTCVSETTDARRWMLSWSLTSAEQPVPDLRLSDDTGLDSWTIVKDTYSADAAVRPVVRPGDVVRVTGPAGSFDAGLDRSRATLESENRESDTEYLDATVSRDASTASLTIPSTLDPAFAGSPALLSIDGTTHVGGAGGSATSRMVAWSGTVDVVMAAPTTTRLLLDLPLGLSFLRREATVVVTSRDGTAPTGSVVVLVDGRPAGSATLTESSQGRATLRLPLLPRGRHSITAEYSGSARLAPSTSAPASLRVLL